METPSRLKLASKKFSVNSNLTWRSDQLPRAPMVLNGPMNLRMHRTAVQPEHRYIGGWQLSSEEASSATDYLWRCRQGVMTPRPRSARAGEVGWNTTHLPYRRHASSRHSITMTEFRKDLEHRYSHRYLGAFYPGPNDQPLGFQELPATPVCRRWSPSAAARPGKSHGLAPAATSIHVVNDSASEASASTRMLNRPTITRSSIYAQ